MTGSSVEDLTARLADRLSALAGSAVRVHGLARLSGGASRETWAFTAEGPTVPVGS